jgi:hypothetical protein
MVNARPRAPREKFPTLFDHGHGALSPAVFFCA